MTHRHRRILRRRAQRGCACSAPGVATGGTQTTTSASTSSRLDRRAHRRREIRRRHRHPEVQRGVRRRPSGRRPGRSPRASTPSALELPTIADPVPGRHRLGGQQLRDVERSRADRVGADHPGLLEQRRHRRVGHRRRARGQPGRRPGRAGRTSPRSPAWSGPAPGPAGRTSAGCRTTPGTAARPRCRSSPCQNCSRSLPETSARLPAETNVDSPSPRLAASARIAMPSAPDWQKKPIRPGGGTTGASVAFIRTRRVGVDHAEAVRSEHPHPGGPRHLDHLPLRARPPSVPVPPPVDGRRIRRSSPPGRARPSPGRTATTSATRRRLGTATRPGRPDPGCR